MRNLCVKFLHKFTIFYTFILCVRFICLPLIAISFIHRAILKPFNGKYLIKGINFFSIITTGGTGGHIFPAIRFSSHAAINGQSICIVTNKNSLPLLKNLGYLHKNHFFYTEEPCESPNGMVVRCLNIQPLKKNIKSIVSFTLAAMRAFWMMCTHGALVNNIIGFGGYVSFPTLFWGVIFCKKIYIHEQNIVFGKVNQLFIPFAKKIFTCLPIECGDVLQKKTYHTGMPLRRSVEQQGFIRKNTVGGEIRILIMSGSSGGGESASAITPAVIHFAKKLDGNIKVYHQASGEHAKTIQKQYERHHIKYEIKAFFDDVYSLLPTVDLCISRSGASSIVDLLSYGVVTIFIPLRNSADNHQIKNASWVAQNNLGFMHKPWESSFYSLVALMGMAIYSNNKLPKNAQKAIKRNARSSMLHYIF